MVEWRVNVGVGAAQVGGIAKARAVWVKLADERIVAAVEAAVKGPRGGGEVLRAGLPGDVGGPRRVDRDAGAQLTAGPAQIGGVGKARAGGVELGGEGIEDAAEAAVKGPRGGGEVLRAGGPGDVGGPGRVDRDVGAVVAGAAPNEGRVGKARAGGVELGGEGVDAAVVAGVEGPRSGGEVLGVGVAGDVGGPAESTAMPKPPSLPKNAEKAVPPR